MKRRKQIDSELDEIKQDVVFLKNRMEILCQWITKKFGDLDFEKDLKNSRQLLSQPNAHNYFSSSIENEQLTITKNSKSQEHSYSSISVTTPNPNLYDMVEEELANNSGEDMFISPPANPSILDTPKKSKPPPITKQVIKSTNAYTPHPHPPTVPLVHNSDYAFTTPPSSVSNDEQIGQTLRQASVVISKEPKKKRSRAKRVRSPKKTSQSASSTSTTNHQLSSDDENPTSTSKTQTQIIQCEICGKLINGPTAMKRHSQTHTNVRAHKCSDCGKSFQRKFHLKTHRLIHDGEKKHQCRFCGKLFLLPKDIVAHERTHTGEKPYPCENCPRKFTLKSHLVMHMRTHTGEKPYKCDSCDKCFTQANSLRVHKKAHLPQSSTSQQNEEKANKIAIKKVQPPPTSHNPASTSMITTMSEYSMRSSNNFNIIGQFIPISPIALPNQLNFTQLQSTSILRIPTQLPVTVLSAGGSSQAGKEVNPSLEPSGNQLIHSLQDEEGYYDLENL